MTVGNEPNYFETLSEFENIVDDKSPKGFEFTYVKMENENRGSRTYGMNKSKAGSSNRSNSEGKRMERLTADLQAQQWSTHVPSRTDLAPRPSVHAEPSAGAPAYP